jgi:hypothetical protein
MFESTVENSTIVSILLHHSGEYMIKSGSVTHTHVTDNRSNQIVIGFTLFRITMVSLT